MDALVCRRGDTCSFVATLGSGDVPLDTRYDKARFVVREAPADCEFPALVDIDETSGIDFDYPNSKITVQIGAQVTKALPENLPRSVAAQLRIYNSTNPNDRISWIIPFVVIPSVICND